MTIEFYLFDVDHGQSAALRLPNRRWCIFDVGCTSTFHPVNWIANRENPKQGGELLATLARSAVPFRFLKATISHWHGDHLDDYANLLNYGPDFIETVDADDGYLNDCYATSSNSSRDKVHDFAQRRSGFLPMQSFPDYGGVTISELCLPVAVARNLGGDANARVNNSSIVTRIDVYGKSILLCGDMQAEAWDDIIADNGQYGPRWRPFLSNIDILVAPHHGHSSGYSRALLGIANPAVVLVSAVSKDPNVDSRYSQDPVRGMIIGNASHRCISTREKGHIKVGIPHPGTLASIAYGSQYGAPTYWIFGDTSLR